MAVFTLPPEMIGFYKKNILYLTEHAINPDRRRYVNKYEAPRHYIDFESYGNWDEINLIPKYWESAVDSLTEDTLMARGIAPWNIQRVSIQLTQAFLKQDLDGILRFSADLGHYIADAHVPLHTTENYNGQLTGQRGIHGLWESRLPELYVGSYDFLVGRAVYIADTQQTAWDIVKGSHQLVEDVLDSEKVATEEVGVSQKYSFEKRGQSTVRVYAEKFCYHYHAHLQGMVEKQMRGAIKRVGDYWFTCWVNAGQPDLSGLGKSGGGKSIIRLDSTIAGSHRPRK